MRRPGGAFRRERVLDDDGALPSGPYFPRLSSAAACISAGSSPSTAASSSASSDPRSYSEPQRKIRRRTWTQPHFDDGCGDEEDDVVSASPSPSTAADLDSAEDAPADEFYVQIQIELDELVGGAEGDAHESPFSWQHGRCATHTLQLSVRAGLAVKPVRDLLDKVRLVAKLRRPSTNFQRQLELSVAAESRAAERSGNVHTATVHRRTLDCPTRWESMLVIVERSWRVVSAVAAALSAHHSQASTGKKEVEALNGQQRSPMKDFRPGTNCPMPVKRHAMRLGLTCATVTALASSDLDRAMTRSCASFQNKQNLNLAARFPVRPPARL
jgi:hypothetical protein